MAVLPGPDSVGPLDDSLPRRMGVGGWNPRVISEDTSAEGRGLDQLGTDLGNVGAQLNEQNTQLQVAQAHAATASSTAAGNGYSGARRYSGTSTGTPSAPPILAAKPPWLLTDPLQ